MNNDTGMINSSGQNLNNKMQKITRQISKYQLLVSRIGNEKKIKGRSE